MSVVVLKNAVSSLVSKKTNNNNGSREPLLTRDSSGSTQYGSSNIQQDLENDVADQSSTDKLMDLTNQNYQHHHSTHSSSFVNRVFGKIDPRIISDMVIGLSDGLTVPFALTAGLSSLGDSKLVITGGFAELISGTISMGLGGYLGAKSEVDYFTAEVKNQKDFFYNDPSLVNHQVEDILLTINENFSDETILSFIKDLQKKPELMVDFIIEYGKGLSEPDPNRQLISAVTIGGGYFIGGLIPLIPYFFVTEVGTGLIFSVIVMAITLFWFGYIKIQLTMGDACSLHKRVVEGTQMVLVGGFAAASAWFLVKLLN